VEGEGEWTSLRKALDNARRGTLGDFVGKGKQRAPNKVPKVCSNFFMRGKEFA